MAMCKCCGGNLRSDNRIGICTTNKDCSNAWERARTPFNKDDRRRRLREFREKNPDYFKVADRKYRYGISPEQWEEMCAEGCWICRIQDRKLFVDHDHSCCPGRLTCGKCKRGALCLACNMRLGFAEKNNHIPLSDAETKYLARFKICDLK